MNATDAKYLKERADKTYELASQRHIETIMYLEDVCSHLDENGNSATRFVKGLERECLGCGSSL